MTRIASIYVFVALSVSPSLGAQDTYLGVLAGKTTARFPDGILHHGSMAGLFFQADFSDHLGFRSEASWVQTGTIEYSPYSWIPQDEAATTRDLEYAEVSAVARLSWTSGALRPMNSRIGVSVFAGGWLGTRIRGEPPGIEPKETDFGHLVGVGLFWEYRPILFQVDARSYHGEVGLWRDGPARKGSQLVFGLGYRIH